MGKKDEVTVWKVVRNTEGKLVSAFVTPDLAELYEVNKWTKSDLPLFAFDSFFAADRFRFIQSDNAGFDTHNDRFQVWEARAYGCFDPKVILINPKTSRSNIDLFWKEHKRFKYKGKYDIGLSDQLRIALGPYTIRHPIQGTVCAYGIMLVKKVG